MSVTGQAEQRTRTKIRVYGVLMALLGLMMFPFYTIVTTTLKPQGNIFAVPANVVPQNVTFEAYQLVWSETNLLLWIANSFLISAGTVLISLLLALPAGYAVARRDFVGRKTFLIAVLVGQMFAPVILIIGLFDIVVNYGMMNSYLAVIIPSAAFTLPFNIWMLYGYIDTIPIELEESAKIDGASQFQIMTKIVIPLTKPGLVATTIYTFLYAWNRLLFVLLFITSSSKYNLPRGIFSMVGVLNTRWRMMLTVAVIGIIPTLIIFAFLEEYIVSGMTSGAVKE